ncbi:LysR family transcriptional regulator [Kitasatospora sp. NPDC052896]|uniref:LysR family transcriptional regulator n=1 Tax=Kitasatospora sp. NPDC052896 TaxID=3364061 RepID=UPI0037C7AD10
MELRQLEHFVTLAEERQFTRAAQRLHLAQSSLSASIQALEHDLGQTLLVRTTRRVELSEAGRALLPLARETLRSARRARQAVEAVGGLLRGRVTVGMIQTVNAVDLPAVLARFHAAHPAVELRLVQGDSRDLVAAVRRGTYDLAVVADAGEAPLPGVDLLPLAREEILLVLAPDHPLADRTSVALAELARWPFVDFREHSGLRALIDEACARAGLSRTITCHVEHMPTLLDLVAHGLGVALVPRSVLPAEPSRLRAVPTRPPLARTVAVATAAGSEPQPAARALLDGIRAEARGER